MIKYKMTWTLATLLFIAMFQTGHGQTNSKEFILIKSRYASYHPKSSISMKGSYFIDLYKMTITSPGSNSEWTQEQKFNLKDVKDVYIKKGTETPMICIYLEGSKVTFTDIEADGKSKLGSSTPTYEIGFPGMDEIELKKIVSAFRKIAQSKGAILIN